MNNKFVVNLHCTNHDHCPQRTGSALQYHLVLRDRTWTGRLRSSRSEHWLPVAYQAGGLLYHYSVLQDDTVLVLRACTQRNGHNKWYTHLLSDCPNQWQFPLSLNAVHYLLGDRSVSPDAWRWQANPSSEWRCRCTETKWHFSNWITTCNDVTGPDSLCYNTNCSSAQIGSEVPTVKSFIIGLWHGVMSSLGTHLMRYSLMKCSVYCYPPECASQNHDAAPPFLPSSRYAAPRSWFLCCGHRAARSDVPRPTNSCCNTVTQHMDDVGHLQYVVLSLLYWYNSNVLNRYTLACIRSHFLSSVVGRALRSWLRDKGSLKKDLQVVTGVVTETAVLLNVTCCSLSILKESVSSASRWKQQICPRH